MRISVIGCGYLGATHAAAMADLGHEVLGMETDPARRATLARGEAPMYEPGLAAMLSEAVGSGRLSFTDSYADIAAFADLHFLCVGTPQSPESLAADVSQVVTAVEGLAPHLDRPALVVGKSTVPVGTAQRLSRALAELAPAGSEAMLAWNPEFLREGFAIQDTLHPDRIVLGVADGLAEKILRDFYAPMIDDGSPVVVTDLATAELVKVAANAFLATKISFVNAMAEVCEATGADVVDLADAIGHDARIGRRFLNAGIGFGGGCLPKDIRAFVHRAGELGVEDAMSFLRHVDDINQRQRERVVKVATAMVGGRLEGVQVGVWGAAFKPDSDDVRDSPALWVAGQLHLGGAGVRIYDPRANASARRVFPPLEYAESAVEAARGAHLVLHLTEWPEFREITPGDLEDVVRRRRIFDGRNVLDLDAWRSAGWTARAVGRPEH
jgi:UDPglucose 6-dehydrogenase